MGRPPAGSKRTLSIQVTLYLSIPDQSGKVLLEQSMRRMICTVESAPSLITPTVVFRPQNPLPLVLVLHADDIPRPAAVALLVDVAIADPDEPGLSHSATFRLSDRHSRIVTGCTLSRQTTSTRGRMDLPASGLEMIGLKWDCCDVSDSQPARPSVGSSLYPLAWHDPLSDLVLEAPVLLRPKRGPIRVPSLGPGRLPLHFTACL